MTSVFSVERGWEVNKRAFCGMLVAGSQLMAAFCDEKVSGGWGICGGENRVWCTVDSSVKSINNGCD